MRRLRSWWRQLSHADQWCRAEIEHLTAARADALSLAERLGRMLDDRTEERDAAYREVDELAAAIGREVAARVAAEAEAERLRSSPWTARATDERARHADAELRGGR